MSKPKHRFVVMAPWGRLWWLTFWRRLCHGVAVGGMVAAARAGRPWQITSDELPSPEQLAASVALQVGSDAFGKWDALAYRTFGVRAPRPDKVPVVFVPCASPRFVVTGGGSRLSA
ncbi:MAG: hypothetical protein WDM84_07965 [Bauldia sp.]